MRGRTYLETAQALAKLLVQQKVPCLLTDYSREAVRDPPACLLPQTSVELSSSRRGICAGAAGTSGAIRGRHAQRADAPAGREPFHVPKVTILCLPVLHLFERFASWRTRDRNEKSAAAGYELPSYSNGFLYGAHPARTPPGWEQGAS